MSSCSTTKIFADYAKSLRSSCKKCEKTIPKSSLRLGLSFKDPRGFDNTKWHHLNCFPLKSNSFSSPDSITGFSLFIAKSFNLSSDQETLKKLVSSGDQSPEKTDEDVESELEERDSKKRKISGAPIAFAITDIKDKYMDAELLPKWKAFQIIIYLERDNDLRDSRKIAAFDFDGCLAKTSVRRVGADAWSLMYPSIPEKLQSLYNDGYKLVFIACGVNSCQQEDPFRKPNPGMWRIMKKQFNSGIQFDLDQSFYVVMRLVEKMIIVMLTQKFAQAIGLKFHLPEEYFMA